MMLELTGRFVQSGIRFKIMRNHLGFESGVTDDAIVKTERPLAVGHFALVLVLLSFGLAAAAATFLKETREGALAAATRPKTAPEDTLKPLTLF